MTAMRILALALGLAWVAAPAAAQQNPVAQCDRLAGDPDDPAHVGQGVPLNDIEPMAAIAACRAAAAAEPGLARMQYQLGRALDRNSEFAAARKAYQAAAAGGHTPAMNNLGAFYEYGLGVAMDEVEAARWYRQSADAGDAVGQNNLANMYVDGRGGLEADPAEAVRLYQLSADQGYSHAEFNLGLMYDLGRGVTQDFAEAERFYTRAIRSDDESVTTIALNALAWMWARRAEKLDEAEQLAIQAVEADPRNGAYLDTLGWVYFHQERHDEAARALAAAVELEPEDPILRDHLGDAYAALGRERDARAEWERALELPPPDPVFTPEWDPAAIERKIAEAM